MGPCLLVHQQYCIQSPLLPTFFVLAPRVEVSWETVADSARDDTERWSAGEGIGGVGLGWICLSAVVLLVGCKQF